MEEDGYFFEHLPIDLKMYPHQIAGHGLVYTKLGIVLHGPDNTCYKPVQAYPKGRNEIDFYKLVHNSESTGKVLYGLRKFIPLFKGLYFNDETNVRYIRMEDCLYGLNLPSVADIKIGAVSYEPDSDPAKIAIEKAKYYWREEVGFLITGMKIYNPTKDDYDHFDRFKGRGLNPEEVYKYGIRCFLGPDSARAVRLAESILSKLRAIEAWFLAQAELAFYASSLLLAYDGVPAQGADPHRTVVRWIDFTHVVRVQRRDDNFLFGLRKLIAYFELLVSSGASAPYILDACSTEAKEQPESRRSQ